MLDPTGEFVPVLIGGCLASGACEAAAVAVATGLAAFTAGVVASKAFQDSGGAKATMDAIAGGPQASETRGRGKADPVQGLQPVDVGRDCDGKCNKCPANIYWWAEGDAHGATGGRQDPVTCICYPNRVSGSAPGKLR